MKETLSQKEHLMTRSEVLNAWRIATGDTKEYQDKKYFSKHLSDGKGILARIDFYPDLLNGHHKLSIRDFSSFEGDHDYLDGVQIVADTAKALSSAGLEFELEAPEGYSDGESIKADVEALLTPLEKGQEAA